MADSWSSMSKIVEVWQFQIYRPLKGWGSPKGAPAQYYDTLTHSYTENFPDACLPAGWAWMTDWTIDTSKAFGESDSNDGWMYGSSFEILYESLKSRTSSGSLNSGSFNRCRRYIRKMVCGTQKAIDVAVVHLERLNHRAKLGVDIFNDKSSLIQNLQEFERDRFELHQSIFDELTQDITDDLDSIQRLSTKLNAMKTYCITRAEIDAEYSNKLMGISSSQLMFSPVTSPLASPSASPDRFTAVTDKSQESSLLARIDQVNYNFSQQYSRLAGLLSSVMMEDVDSLIMQTEQVFNSYKTHISQENNLIAQRQEAIKNIVDRFDRCIQSVQTFVMENVTRLRRDIQSYSQIGTATRPDSDSKAFLSEETSGIHSAAFGIKQSSPEDCFLYVYNYRKAVYDMTCLLSSLQQIARSIKVLSIKLANQCHAVITVIAKFLSSEQAKLWISCGNNLLSAIELITSSEELESSPAREYALPVAPESPDSTSLGDRFSKMQLSRLLDLLKKLPVCPNVVYREVVEATSVDGLIGNNALIDLDWNTSQLILTTDGYIHVLKSNGFDLPVRSYNSRKCSIKPESLGMNSSVNSCISIQPIITPAPSPTNSKSLLSMRGQPTFSASNENLQALTKTYSNLDTNVGIVIYFPSPEAAESFLMALSNIQSLLAVNQATNDLQPPSAISYLSKVYRENEGGNATVSYDDDKNTEKLDVVYGDLSITLLPKETHPFCLSDSQDLPDETSGGSSRSIFTDQENFTVEYSMNNSFDMMIDSQSSTNDRTTDSESRTDLSPSFDIVDEGTQSDTSSQSHDIAALAMKENHVNTSFDAEANQTILSYLTRNGEVMTFEEFVESGIADEIDSTDCSDSNDSKQEQNQINHSKIQSWRSKHGLLNKDKGKAQTNMVYQRSLYEAMFAAAAAASGNNMLNMSKHSYKPPIHFVPGIGNKDPKYALPFSRKNSQRVLQYQQALAIEKREKEMMLAKMSSMRVINASKNRLLKEFKGVGERESHTFVKSLGEKWSNALSSPTSWSKKKDIVDTSPSKEYEHSSLTSPAAEIAFENIYEDNSIVKEELNFYRA